MKKIFTYIGCLFLLCSSRALMCADIAKETDTFFGNVLGAKKAPVPSVSTPLPSAPTSPVCASPITSATPEPGILDTINTTLETAWGKVTYPFKATWNAGTTTVEWVQNNPGKTAAIVFAAALTGRYLHKKFKNFFTPINAVADFAHKTTDINGYYATITNMDTTQYVAFAQIRDINALVTSTTVYLQNECRRVQTPQTFRIDIYVSIKGLIGRRALAPRIFTINLQHQDPFGEFQQFFALHVTSSLRNIHQLPQGFVPTLAQATLKNVSSSLSFTHHFSAPSWQELNRKIKAALQKRIQHGAQETLELCFTYKNAQNQIIHIEPFRVTINGTQLLQTAGYYPQFGYLQPAPATTRWNDFFNRLQECRTHRQHFEECQELAANNLWTAACAQQVGVA